MKYLRGVKKSPKEFLVPLDHDCINFRASDNVSHLEREPASSGFEQGAQPPFPLGGPGKLKKQKFLKLNSLVFVPSMEKFPGFCPVFFFNLAVGATYSRAFEQGTSENLPAPVVE